MAFHRKLPEKPMETLPKIKSSEQSVHNSYAISLARILLVVGLVFLHYGCFPNSEASPFIGLDITAHRFATWMNSAILFFFFSCVPLLSMISGWLFFSFHPDNAWHSIRKRIRRRFLSLYMPLVVWNAAYLVILYIIFVTHPHLSLFANSKRIHLPFLSADWMEYFNSIFAVTGIPVAFQFWFVRDLFVTCLISPVLWLMMRYIPWAGAVTLGLIWLSGLTLGIFTDFDVPFFFYMGGLIYQKQLPLAIPLRWTVPLMISFIAIVGLRALSPYIVPADVAAPFWLELATRLMRIVGVLGCWGVFYRLAATSTGIRISQCGGLAFFLHSAHWPLLAVVKLAVWRLMPSDSDAWMLVHFFASATLTVAIGLAAGIGLAKKSPRIFALMNGGRLLGQIKDQRPAPETIAPPQDEAPQGAVLQPAA